jgi:riboflavin kinase / FMN adenylyltransferase
LWRCNGYGGSTIVFLIGNVGCRLPYFVEKRLCRADVKTIFCVAFTISFAALYYMQVHYQLQDLPPFKNAVLTIGTFDGVHTGHQQIIKLMLAEAERTGGETVVVTFHPHPRQVIAANQSAVFLLNTLQEKIVLLEKYGIKHLVVTPFTEAFSLQTAEAYIADFLVKTFHPHTIIIGHDHRFGRSRSGNFELLEARAADLQYRVKEIPPYMLENSAISSTRVREALQRGAVEVANEFLGYAYFFSGIVVEGNKLGRTLGFPTANLHIAEEKKLVPGNGVYAVEVELQYATGDKQGRLLKGMMNIGIRPTVEGTLRMIEVNLFDFDEEIYGDRLTVYVKKRLRSEQKFMSLEELKLQLAKDKMAALTIS